MTSVRIGSVWPHIGFWQRATPDQRRVIAHAVTVARETAAYRRRIVLAHPDLCEVLVRQLGYIRPDQWGGFVPPRWYECGGYVAQWYPNDSPVRAALLDLVAEAEAREARP